VLTTIVPTAVGAAFVLGWLLFSWVPLLGWLFVPVGLAGLYFAMRWSWRLHRAYEVRR
jgi:hypothetical protein